MGEKVETANTEDGGPPPWRDGGQCPFGWAGAASQLALSFRAGQTFFLVEKAGRPRQNKRAIPEGEREEESERDSNLERGLSLPLPLSPSFSLGNVTVMGGRLQRQRRRRQLYGSERRQSVPPSVVSAFLDVSASRERERVSNRVTE